MSNDALLLKITRWPSVTETTGRTEEITWADLIAELSEHRERGDKGGPGFSLASFTTSPPQRANANVALIYALVQDTDDGSPLDERPEAHWQYESQSYSTFSDTPDAPRYRTVYPLARPVTPEEWPLLWEEASLLLAGGHIDRQCKDASRFYYHPTCPIGAQPWAHCNPGRLLDPDELLKAAAARRDVRPRPRVSLPTNGNHRAPVEKLLESACRRMSEGRNPVGFLLAQQLRDNGYSEAEALAVGPAYVARVPATDTKGKLDAYTLGEYEHSVREAYKCAPRDPWPDRRLADRYGDPPPVESAPTNGDGPPPCFDYPETDENEGEPTREFGDEEASEAGAKKPAALWKRWVSALQKEQAKTIWTDTAEAFFQPDTGELLPVHSDEGARWFQQRALRDAYYRSERWQRAAGGLRSWIEEHGERAEVFHRAKVDFARQTAWVGCEDGRTLYRLTPGRIERVPNGTDGVLILGGWAPDLGEEVTPTGELVRWLIEDTWATPVARLAIAIFMVRSISGARSYEEREMLIGIGGKGSGKTTTLQMAGSAVAGTPTIAQTFKGRDEQNESRILNEHLAIFDNLELPPRDLSPEDFLANACTSQWLGIRRMRAEGEQVRKPITAFVAVTSFSVPRCLTRADILDRALILEFHKPDGSEVAAVNDRLPDRRRVWADLLTLFQKVLRGWPDTPTSSTSRAIGFRRFAHALLSPQAAAEMERRLIHLQAATAGLDDPILVKLESDPPQCPLIAADLYQRWWRESDPDRPKSSRSLGCLLREKAGNLGGWKVIGETDGVRNLTLWRFERTPEVKGMLQPEAEALLLTLVPGAAYTPPPISAPSPTPGAVPVPEIRI